MKKLSLELLIALAVLISSCTGSTEKKSSEESKEKKEKIVLDNKEDMLAKLKEFNIIIPEGMEFDRVEMTFGLDENFEDDTSHMVYFMMNEVDEKKQAELEQWYVDQRQTLIDNGWELTRSADNKERIPSGTQNHSSFKKESINCKLGMGISFSEGRSGLTFNPNFD